MCYWYNACYMHSYVLLHNFYDNGMATVCIAVYKRPLQKFQDELRGQQINIDKIRYLAEEILQSCHPNAVRFVKYYLTITQTRWEQVGLVWFPRHLRPTFATPRFFDLAFLQMLLKNISSLLLTCFFRIS